MSEHSKRPWRSTSLAVYDSDAVVYGPEHPDGSGGHLLIARVSLALGQPWQGECEANARLIAAAPDLLAALRGLVNCHTGADWQTAEVQRRWWLAAADAIAKATR